MKKLLTILLLCSTLLADSSGPLVGTAAGGWTGSANVAASDNVYATFAIGSVSVSDDLYTSGLAFAIPVGATVNGIAATLERKCSGSASCTTDPTFPAGIWLTKTADSPQGTNKGTAALWAISDVTQTLGSSSDLWGSTWTVSEINATGFGLLLIVGNENGSSRTASVDYMAVTVYYTPSGSGSHRRVVISQTRTVQLRHSNV